MAKSINTKTDSFAVACPMIDKLIENVGLELKCKQLMLIKQPYAVKYCLKMVNRIKNVNLLAADMRLDDYIVGV
jgi:hypothetical protein